jgi:hypothetical protein
MRSKAGRIAIGATTAVVAATGILLAARGSPPPAEELGCREPLDGRNPLGNGVLMTPWQAEHAFDPPLFRPQTEHASDETIAELWVRTPRSSEAFIVYDSGIVVIVEPWKRPTWQFARDQIADGVPGELREIRGIDAFVIPPDPPCFGGNTSLNIDGADLAIIGDVDLPFSSVRRAAESIIDTAASVEAADAAEGT